MVLLLHVSLLPLPLKLRQNVAVYSFAGCNMKLSAPCSGPSSARHCGSGNRLYVGLDGVGGRRRNKNNIIAIQFLRRFIVLFRLVDFYIKDKHHSPNIELHPVEAILCRHSFHCRPPPPAAADSKSFSS